MKNKTVGIVGATIIAVGGVGGAAAVMHSNSTKNTSSPSSNCDPNYSGACVPNVYPSDVDCAGGSGNGPYYVAGPVQIIGTDHYGLDRDGNGIGCE